MSNKTLTIGLVAVAIMAFGAYFFPQVKSALSVGTACDQITCIDGGLRITNGPLESTGDVTASGGTINISTSNTATSTLVVGCIQTTATSTASPVKLVVTAISTTTTTFGNGTTGFAVVAAFGTCPNL